MDEDETLQLGSLSNLKWWPQGSNDFPHVLERWKVMQLETHTSTMGASREMRK